jgi:hypothetical protein
LPAERGRRPITMHPAPRANNMTATRACRPAGTPVLASTVVVVFDEDVVDEVVPVPNPFVAVPEPLVFVFVPVPAPDVVVRALTVMPTPVPEPVAVAELAVVGRVAVDGRTVPLGRLRVDVAGPVVALLVGPVDEDGAVVEVGLKMFTIEALQVTVEPPPFTEWLH